MQPAYNPLLVKDLPENLATVWAKSLKGNTTVPDQRFPLMKLLPELRIRIYECIFADLADTITPPSQSTLQNLDEHLRLHLRGFIALLHASQVLRSEGIEVYCRAAKVQSATLNKNIRELYGLIKLSGGVFSWNLLMEVHARQLAMRKVETMFRVVRFAMSGGCGEHGWTLAALEAAMNANDAERMGAAFE